jgi:hypothetical protein
MLPDKAASIASVLELRRKALETSELAEKLRVVEQQLATSPRRVLGAALSSTGFKGPT